MPNPTLLSVALWSTLLLLTAFTALAGEQPWTAPAAERERKNPIPHAAGLPEGKKVFETNCTICHGPTGKGDGPAAAALTPSSASICRRHREGGR
jgi:mono/diheme cytochrome c family protein